MKNQPTAATVQKHLQAAMNKAGHKNVKVKVTKVAAATVEEALFKFASARLREQQPFLTDEVIKKLRVPYLRVQKILGDAHERHLVAHAKKHPPVAAKAKKVKK